MAIRVAQEVLVTDIRERNIMVLKQAKEDGVKVVGMYCSYCPRELVMAAGTIHHHQRSSASICGSIFGAVYFVAEIKPLREEGKWNSARKSER